MKEAKSAAHNFVLVTEKMSFQEAQKHFRKIQSEGSNYTFPDKSKLIMKDNSFVHYDK